MGLSYTGNSCFDITLVKGYNGNFYGNGMFWNYGQNAYVNQTVELAFAVDNAAVLSFRHGNTCSEPPTKDYNLANKKYVDDKFNQPKEPKTGTIIDTIDFTNGIPFSNYMYQKVYTDTPIFNMASNPSTPEWLENPDYINLTFKGYRHDYEVVCPKIVTVSDSIYYRGNCSIWSKSSGIESLFPCVVQLEIDVTSKTIIDNKVCYGMELNIYPIYIKTVS